MPGAILSDNGKTHFFISRAGTDAHFAAAIGGILEDAGHRVILQQWDFANRDAARKEPPPKWRRLFGRLFARG